MEPNTNSSDVMLNNALISSVLADLHSQSEKLEMKNSQLKKENGRIVTTFNKQTVANINLGRK